MKIQPKIGEVEKMKNRQSVFPMALAAIAAMVVWLANPWTIASAQVASTASAGPAPVTASGGAQAPTLPHGASEALKLYKAGISKDVIINYIDSTVMPYHLTADGIIYLQSIGVPQEITQAMILRDGQLQQQFSQQYYQQQMAAANAAAAAQGSAPVMTPTTPAPDVSVIGSDYPGYYGYGYGYGWPYYGYGWPIGFGGGWGWGNRGFHGGIGGFRGGIGGFRGGIGGFRGGIGGSRGGGGFHGGFGGGHMGGGHGGGGGHR
jgi:hypothetical protein